MADAPAADEAERRPPTAAIVLANRRGGPERVIDLVESRAPDGCTDIDAAATHAEREAIVRGYGSLAGTHAVGRIGRLAAVLPTLSAR